MREYRKYQELLYAAAREQGLASVQVRGLRYRQTASLCGVDTNVPNFEFSFDSAKNYVANKLAREEKAAALIVWRAVFESAIREKPGYSQVTVEITDDGELKINTSSLSARMG